jgi:hypothetical protein
MSVSGCAANLCQRKENWLENHCSGTDVTWSHDAMCEDNIDKCDPGHMKQLEGYVMCLESQNSCSLDTIGQCGQSYPGGVNLVCTGS